MLDAGPLGEGLTTTLVLSSLVAASLLVAGVSVALPAPHVADPLHHQLRIVAPVLGLLCALLCHLRWRLVGDAAAVWLSATLVVWSLAVGAEATAAAAVTPHPLAVWARPTGLLVAVVLAVLGLRSPDIDAGLRPRRVLGLAVGAVVAGSFAGAWLAGSLDLAPPAVGSGLDRALALGSVLIGAGHLRRGRGLGRPLLAWFGVALLLLGYAHLLGVAPGNPAWQDLGRQLLQLTAVLAAIAGATVALLHAYQAQGGRLLEAEAQRLAAQDRVEVDHARQAERAHEARNALAAIQGATHALQAYSDRLADVDREQLTDAVNAEIARLQQLVSPSAPEAPRGRFRLSEAIAAVVTCERSLGAWIEADVADDLVAIGSPTDTAEVVQNLLQNARRYGRGPIRLSAQLDDEHVVLRVRDEGPGIHPAERTLVFERGGRGRSGACRPGSGLGLYLSTQLMHAQGGTLALEDSPPGSGACFRLRFPGFREARDVVSAAGDDAAVPSPGPGRMFLVPAAPAVPVPSEDTERSALTAEPHLDGHLTG
ncbi:hypothetical protein GCM10011354_11010 [Egicoccus halophilus]|uniref:histidine kinase n=1 Tax=Egicoccus halophilus TaxID=1670830 RepID=A0A8J3A6T3_9ACTN|nr:hypothetical protein GCM10011354_11010 [Egicoccus halophilus]